MSIVLPALPVGMPIAARFKLIARCHNCWRTSASLLPVPEVEDAPTDTDELLESGLLGSLGFLCTHCEGTICEVVGASRAGEEDEACSR